MRKYFSLLDKEDFTTWDKKKQVDYLVTKKACLWTKTIKGSINDNVLFGDENTAKLVFKPNQDMIEEFYEYILKKYDSRISNAYIFFFRDFNNSVFGLSREDKTDLGLKSFNKIYEEVNISEYDIIKQKKGLGIIATIEESSRFEKLHLIQRAKKINVCPLPIAMEFFYGNDEFFNSDEFKNIDSFNDAISFETALKILVNLNDRFQFEKDFYFNEDGVLRDLYKKHDHIFLTYEAFEWTHKSIPNFKEIIPAQLDSLYQALLDLELIVRHKSNFQNYIISEYNFDRCKIRFIEKGINLDHDGRVNIFMRDLPKKSIVN